MKVRQLSIFLENRFGRLAGITKIFDEAGIDILAISVADTADFGILRVIVRDIDRAADVLNQHGVVSRINDVFVVEIGKTAGSLAKIVSILQDANINVEYMYAVAQTTIENPLMIFRFVESEQALDALSKAGIHIVTEQELFA